MLKLNIFMLYLMQHMLLKTILTSSTNELLIKFKKVIHLNLKKEFCARCMNL